MKKNVKDLVICALCLVFGLSAFLLTGCGELEKKPRFTVAFVQNGEAKAEITVEEGKKVSETDIVKPASEGEGYVTEWNYDFDEPVTADKTVNTTHYTKGLEISKSLTGKNYVVSGYDGQSKDVYMPDFYNGGEVTSIKNEAFRNNHTVVSVRFPAALVSVGVEAFKGCVNLVSVNLPETVTTLGASAFVECESLDGIVVPPLVTSIPTRFVQGCKFDFIDVPEGVTTIGEFAFACKATRMVLPKSLRRIDGLGLWDELQTIYYKGADYDWDNVIFSEKAQSVYDGGGNLVGEFSVKTIIDRIEAAGDLYFYSEIEPTKSGNFWHYENGEPVIW